MKVSIEGCRRPQRGLIDINFSSFSVFEGRPIYTTAGGGLGIEIEALSVGYHLEPFLSSWVHYSRIYGSYSDFGLKKVEIFFEATTFGNSSFCRYSEWEQKTHS